MTTITQDLLWDVEDRITTTLDAEDGTFWAHTTDDGTVVIECGVHGDEVLTVLAEIAADHDDVELAHAAAAFITEPQRTWGLGGDTLAWPDVVVTTDDGGMDTRERLIVIDAYKSYGFTTGGTVAEMAVEVANHERAEAEAYAAWESEFMARYPGVL